MADATKEVPRIPQFTDAEGRRYSLRLDGRKVREWEQISGIGFFEGAFEAIEKIAAAQRKGAAEQEDSEITEGVMIRASKHLLSNVGNLLYLAYLGATPKGEKQAVGMKTSDSGKLSREIVEFDDFCSAVSEDVLATCFAATMAMVFQFFPFRDADDSQKGGKPDDPFERILGGISSSSAG